MATFAITEQTNQQLNLEQIAELQTIARNVKREWSNPEMTKDQITEAETKKDGEWKTMKPAEIMPAIDAMLEAGWTSAGITLEQTSSDAGYTKYFHDKDDAEMGGHWNIVSGKEELG